ncbi:unnamed protein product [Ambrosiozyma monospora]|uniref:Unnamed protein product n=1 Tax=Ambrosiozyma monospora TaxID=43982 RepID=A0A9W7DI66_AMBMO|nr:unnamed protein product [Ambrosiozyma monospora]
MVSLEEQRQKVQELEDEITQLREQYSQLRSTVGSEIQEQREAQQGTTTTTTKTGTSADSETEFERPISARLPTRHPRSSTNAISNSNKRKREEDYYVIPRAAHHEYFDDLINSLLVEDLNLLDEKENEADAEKKRKVRDEQSQRLNDYEELKVKYVPNVQLENIYRLGGITAFPVNDPDSNFVQNPKKKDSSVPLFVTDDDDDEEHNDIRGIDQPKDRYLGIRFDVFDRKYSRFVTPHYIILKKVQKNDNWEIFKTTIPKFIPYRAIALKYLNTELFRFASEIRENLIQLQLKRNVFLTIQEELESPSKLDYDLGFTKVSINILGKFEMIVICNLYKITNVIVFGSYKESDGLLTIQLKKKLEILLKGCKVCELEKQFFEIMGECGLNVR